MWNSVIKWFDRLHSFAIVQAIQRGLVMSVPVLMTGSAALVLLNFPVQAYLDFINTALGGALRSLFNMVYSAAFSYLSIYMTFTISRSYAEIRSEKYHREPELAASLVSLAVFLIFSGVGTPDFDITCLGAKGMFMAILCSIGGVEAYYALRRRRRLSMRLFSDGADSGFNSALAAIFPAIIILVCAAAVNTVIMTAFSVSGAAELFINGATLLFSHVGRNLGGGLLFVFMSSFMWFFGIHGSDVLEGVTEQLFTPATQINAQAIAGGGAPTEIFSKTFFDVFVLMGGCGAAMCLLLALLIFGRRRSTRRLSAMAALPMLFNINEIMIFGLPVVFNPILLIPFLLTPAVCLLTSWFAMSVGLVPLPINEIQWTTPVLLGGFSATGSLSGALLQLFNLALGTLIYRPFVRLYDTEKTRSAGKELKKLAALCDSETRALTELPGAVGEFAKSLVADLEHALSRGELRLHFQPQYDQADACVGAEALLRWEHPVCGMVYPPLAVRLARESGCLWRMEQRVFTMAAQALCGFPEQGFRLSVNLTADSLLHPEAEGFFAGLMSEYSIARGRLCIELTEQTALDHSEETEQLLQRLRDMGIAVAIDDFSMGHTSIKYLQSCSFDIVKLDGELVRGMDDNARCADIISSIVYLSRSLGFIVIAEYVETAEQKQRLADIGCHEFQGWLYSPAVGQEELIALLKEGRP